MVADDFWAGNCHGDTARVNPLVATVRAAATLSACGGQKLAGAGRYLLCLWPYARGYPPFVVTFDYGAGTVRFGTNLDPAEARQIVALLKERFGQYMADGKVEAGKKPTP
jgi:hypothetical protein